MLTFERPTQWANPPTRRLDLGDLDLPLPAAPAPARATWGLGDFALVGVVALLALTVGFLEIRQVIHRNACKNLAVDLVAQAEAFRRYAAEHDGNAPDATEPGLPAGMQSYVSEAKWSEPTLLGGHYRWLRATEKNPEGKPRFLGGIALTAFNSSPALTLTPADLRAIDEQIDDGNLATGRFRTGFNGWPVYWVNIEP